ncbi:FAD-dependent monooxygenase [Streptomyces sp. NBC_01508]|uniref:FAD-dependent monooxygenase n=1 Tax=Streptomyces sp. NBC_01508 TaxID=2903888 RepID=UPI00386F013A
MSSVSSRGCTGRTTLVGDAAHTMPPIVAQGANRAREDAWVLARSLGNGHHDPVATLRRYERLRRRVVRPIARFDATEYTYRYHPPVFDRLIPGGAAVSRAYGHWLRGANNYLRARDHRRRSGTP